MGSKFIKNLGNGFGPLPAPYNEDREIGHKLSANTDIEEIPQKVINEMVDNASEEECTDTECPFCKFDAKIKKIHEKTPLSDETLAAFKELIGNWRNEYYWAENYLNILNGDIEFNKKVELTDEIRRVEERLKKLHRQLKNW